jgi:hypothetical protein
MYRLIRNTHLILGLSASLILLVYAVSAVQMAHQFAIRPRVSSENLTLAPGLGARSVSQQLMDEHGYRGDLGEVTSAGQQIRFSITRPGTAYDVTYDPAAGRARIVRRELPFMGLLNRLHHLNGFEHSNAAMNAWGWILAWISMALILLGATGVYMWFRIHNERRIGSVLLAANLSVSIVLLILLRRP